MERQIQIVKRKLVKVKQSRIDPDLAVLYLQSQLAKSSRTVEEPHYEYKHNHENSNSTVS